MRPYSVNQIQNFLEVVWQKPVSESADRSFVTQPADSMQICQLERAFGHAML
jgi:DNA-binding transcriptional LysR family regulator